MSECCCNHEHHHHDHNHKKELLLTIISALLLVTSLFCKNSLVVFAIRIVATVLTGYDLIISGVKNIIKLSLDETVLMTIAIISAFAIGESFEGCIVTVLFKIGEFIEDRAVSGSRKRIDALLDIMPDNATVIGADNSHLKIPAKKVAIGDTLLIKAGERVPLDCIITEGSGEIDTSAVTGESIPRYLSEGETLLSGMINQTALLKCRVIKDYENSTANKIAKLVKSASEKKGLTENFIGKFAKIYTPIVVILAVFLTLIPTIISPQNFIIYLKRSLIFLVASCPCALVISVPLTFYSAIGTISKKGALIKGSKYIETLSKAKIFVFDKTGTLTSGKIEVSNYDTLSNISKEEVLRLSAICESISTHPIANAVTKLFDDIRPPEEAYEISGKGVKAIIDGKVYYCGSYKLMQDISTFETNLPKANIYLSDTKKVLGYIIVSDTIKPEAKSAISKLKDLKINKIAILTGDGKSQTEDVAKQLQIDAFFSNLLPSEKAQKLLEFKKEGITVFIGDGINDGPVLATADLGISMGAASDLATEASDMVLLSNNLKTLPTAVRIARKAMLTVTANLLFIFTVKALVLILGALGYAPMASAVFADVGVTLITVLYSLRILKAK